MNLRAVKVGMAAGFAVMVAVVVTSPAQASVKNRTCQVDQAKYQLCFDPDNDSFLIADDVSDGRRAVVHWNAWDGSGREGECADTNGALNGWTVCDYDFIEGRTNYVAFQGMTRNGANGSNSDNSWVYNGYITPR